MQKNKVSSAEALEAQYDHFIDTVVQTKQVWGLVDQAGDWVICASAAFEETDVWPFWSSEQGAKQHCQDEWEAYQPAVIALADFLTDWLPGMHEDDALVGPDWNEELEGLEIEPADVAKEFELAITIE